MECAKEDEDMTIAILLTAFGPLRRSEICRVERSDIDNNHVLHIQRAVAMYDTKYDTK